MLGGSRKGRGGFTLIEILIVTVVFAIVMGAAMQFLMSATTQYQTLAPIDHVQDLGRAAIDRVAEDCRASQAGSFVITTYNGASDVQMQEIVSYNSGTGLTTWKTIEYRLEASTVDANGDGNTTDDWKLVRYDNGVKVVDTNYVVAGGFTVTQSGNDVVIVLTMICHNGQYSTKLKAYETATRTITTSATLRN